MRRGKRVLWILSGLIVLVVAYIAAWQWDLLPREVIATGTIDTRDGKTLKTRQFYRTSRAYQHKSPTPGPIRREAVWEVQLPSGRWIDCDGDDCLAAYEKTLR
jgi:hypothetical protein